MNNLMIPFTMFMPKSFNIHRPFFFLNMFLLFCFLYTLPFLKLLICLLMGILFFCFCFFKSGTHSAFRHKFFCEKCGKKYKYKEGLYNHQKYECGVEPQFQCPYCTYKGRRKMHVQVHVVNKHSEFVDVSKIKHIK